LATATNCSAAAAAAPAAAAAAAASAAAFFARPLEGREEGEEVVPPWRLPEEWCCVLLLYLCLLLRAASASSAARTATLGTGMALSWSSLLLDSLSLLLLLSLLLPCRRRLRLRWPGRRRAWLRLLLPAAPAVPGPALCLSTAMRHTLSRRSKSEKLRRLTATTSNLLARLHTTHSTAITGRRPGDCEQFPTWEHKLRTETEDRN
jgi:hypothetical protein